MNYSLMVQALFYAFYWYELNHNLLVMTLIPLNYTSKEIFMKFRMTTVNVVAFAASGCKKDTALRTSNNADSIAAYDHNSISLNNSSSISTEF
jgi:hypothetical protein